MAKVLVSESNLTNIANAIRTKNGSSNTYTPAQMATAIENISTGITPTGSISITENDTYDVTNYASAVVNVASAKYGITIDNFIGDVNQSGVLQDADAATTITFTGVQEIDKSKGADINYLMRGKNLGGISAPALTNLGWESAISSFESCPGKTNRWYYVLWC